MSRPRKNVEGVPTAEPKIKIKRIDPLPNKVYFKHFAANLSLGCVRNSDGIQKVYLFDSTTNNYSDVTAIDEITAAAKKMFKGKASQQFIMAAFFNLEHATVFIEQWLDAIGSNDLKVETETTDVPVPVTE